MVIRMDKEKHTPQEEDWVGQLLQDVAEETGGEGEGPAAAPEASASRQEQRVSPRHTGSRPSSGRSGGQRPRRRAKRVRVKRVGIFNTFLYLAVVLAVCAGAAIFCIQALGDVLAVSRPNVAVEVTIPKDADAEQIGQILKEEGLIKFPWLFQLIADYEKKTNFESGSFVLNQNMGYSAMMDTMQKQKQSRKTVMVTIPEGYTLVQIARTMEENGVCESADFLNALRSTDFGYSFEKNIPKDGMYYRMEGYLFPDTYEFYQNDTALNVIKKMMDNFERKVTPEVQKAMKNAGMTLHEAITLASIIQGEAPDTENMALVSSVYHNRLDNPGEYPRLQADPTRKYADEVILTDLGEEGQLLAERYNTYSGQGLPPGPINNPGMAAILAAINPEESSYFYFCSDLKTRVFYYAETLDQHNQNLYKAHLK